MNRVTPNSEGERASLFGFTPKVIFKIIFFFIRKGLPGSISLAFLPAFGHKNHS